MKVATKLLCMFALVTAWPVGAAAESPTTAQFVWHQALGGHDEDLRIKDAAVDGHENTWVLLTMRPKGALVTRGSLALWRLQPTGDRDRVFRVALPAAHGELSNADDPAFVRISAQGNPVVAARTKTGVSVVELDSADGALTHTWLVTGIDALVALTPRAKGLAVITARQVFALHASHPPQPLLTEAPGAPLVAAVGERDQIALVAVGIDAEQGNQAHVAFLDDADKRMPPLVSTALDLDTTLGRNISYSHGGGIDVLAALKSEPGRWRRLSFDASANLTASQLLEVPGMQDLPRTLDAQPLAGGDVLLAGAKDATFWLTRLHDDGALVPVALAPAESSPPQLPMFALDVRLRATANPQEFMLLATQVSGNATTRRNDHGLFIAKVALSAPQ